MSMLPGGRRKKHFQGKFEAPITLISSGDPDIRSLDLVHGEERRADSDHREGRVGDVVRCHLSGNYWPGRPMRGGGVKCNLTYLPFSDKFRNFSHKFHTNLEMLASIFLKKSWDSEKSFIKIGAKSNGFDSKITTTLANIEKVWTNCWTNFAGNLRAERCESMEIL